MASTKSSLVRNIDENFCQCSICLEQFKEPKLLPCLHRICRDCLRRLIQDAQGVLKCPECRDESEVPTGGVDDFKTDFYMNSIVDFIQLQKSLQDDKIKECFNCSKNTKASAYCFKCCDFFCDDCHKHHVTSKMMKDHKSHVLSIEDVESKNISLEKLVSLKDLPRCQTHSENLSQLCCSTCDNLPVCVACTFGKHKDHAIIDVTSLASTERDRLTEKLTLLLECKGNLDKMTDKVSNLEEQIISNGKEETRKLHLKYEDKVKEIESKRNKICEGINIEKLNLEANSRKRNSVLQENMDKEIQEIKDKYDKLFESERKETERELNELQEKMQNEEAKLDGMRFYLERKLHFVIKFIEKKREKKLKRNREIAHHFVNTTKRYENLTSTAASIITAQSDWTAVNCIPDILFAINPVIKDVDKEFPELNEIADFGLRESSLVDLNVAHSVTVANQAESIIDIRFVGTKMSDTHSHYITYTESGNIVACGPLLGPPDEVHFTVLDMDGTLVEQSVKTGGNTDLRSFCASLSKFKVVMVLTHDEIDLVDICTGSHVTKKMNDIVTRWTDDQFLHGVCVDKSNNLIYVNSVTDESRFIHAIDDQLKLHRTLTLPRDVLAPVDIAYCKGEFFLCVLCMKTIYRIDMEGNVISKLQYLPGENWGPIGVCADKNGFIYTLWISNVPDVSREESNDDSENESEGGVESISESLSENNDGENKQVVLVQYIQDGSRVLAVKAVDPDIRSITTYEKDHEEKLLLATLTSRKIYVFGLVR